MNETKVTSLRLPKELAAELAALARVEGVTISEAGLAAVYRYITIHRADEDFKKRLKEHMEEELKVLERLAE